MDDTTTIIVIVLGAFYTVATYGIAALVVRSVNRRAEREQARHEATEREATQTILFLARRSGEPQAWASEPIEDALEQAARVRAQPEQMQPYGDDFNPVTSDWPPRRAGE